MISSFNELIDYYEDHQSLISDTKFEQLSYDLKQKVTILEFTNPVDTTINANNEPTDELQSDTSKTSIHENELPTESSKSNQKLRQKLIELTPKELLGAMSRLGHHLLLKHYNRVSEIGEIAMVLDPKKNLHYMEVNEWSDSLIQDIKQR